MYNLLHPKPFVYLFFMCVGSFCGCTRLVDVPTPSTSINAGNIYEDDATAIAAVTAIYAKMSAGTLRSSPFTSLSLYCGLSADEYNLYSGVTDQTLLEYYMNALSSSYSTSYDVWANLYPIIYLANLSMEGINGSTKLNAKVKQQLMGECHFVRAYCYFFLVNLYGDVPLVLGTDYKLNSQMSRMTSTVVWDQIKTDLIEAKKLLRPAYLDSKLLETATERVRPCQATASALLSRLYLYNKDYTNAEIEATSIIQQTNLYQIETDISKTFLKGNHETIWQLQPVAIGWNTPEARLFILPSSGPSNSFPIYLSDNLLNSFEAGDIRKDVWIGRTSVGFNTYYYSHKYKSATLNDPVTEYTTPLRLSEQFLIRAEARVENGKIIEGVTDLDVIRGKSGLQGYKGQNDKEHLLAAILQERRVELFSEYGNRWLDLKRTGNVNSVMTEATGEKGGSWKKEWQFYPIRSSELLKSPNIRQNPGYN